MSCSSLIVVPSSPMATLIPARFISSAGAIPLNNLRFELGLCTAIARVLARIEMSSLVNQIEWAQETSVLIRAIVLIGKGRRKESSSSRVYTRTYCRLNVLRVSIGVEQVKRAVVVVDEAGHAIFDLVDAR